MRKIVLFAILLILTTNLALASLEVQKTDKGSTVIAELDNPALFELTITNNESGEFEIYSLVGVSMGPKGFFTLRKGETKLEVTAFPSESLRKIKGYLKFEYQIKRKNAEIFRDSLLIKIVPLKETLQISSEPIKPSDTNATITIKNKENTNLNNLKIELESVFFKTTKTISLEPYEEIQISVELNKEIKEITAGPYLINSKIEIKNKKTEIKGIIEYLEKEGTSVKEYSEGLIIRKKTIRKTNEGNKQTTTKIEIKKGIISRLFTINSPEPTFTEREGTSIYYIWEETLAPGESLVVKSTTNYTFPFILIILIIAVALTAKIYSQTPITIKKKVSLVKTKNREFALKVTLEVKSRKHINKIQLIDSIPPMTKLYEKFGRKPDTIDKKTRRLFWSIPSISPGEKRIYSYIIYSKLNIIGRFELPLATAVFEHADRTHEVWSNRSFLVNEKTD